MMGATFRPGRMEAMLRGIILCCSLAASQVLGSTYTPAWQNELLGITYWVPPITAYLEDGLGRKLGNAPSSTVSAEGVGPRIEQLPSADISVHSEGDEEHPERDVPSPSAWVLKVYDGGNVPYTLNIRGIQDSLTTIKIRLSIRGRSGAQRVPAIRKDLFVASDSHYRLTIIGDGAHNTLSVVRVAAPEGLVTSVEVANRLGRIKPDGIYQSLRAKAAAISEASSRNRLQAVRGLAGAFLSEVDALTGKHLDTRVATILREEAQSILNSLQSVNKGKSTRATRLKTGR